MDIESISVWLKSTISGIIILGAIGSILAAFLILVAKRLLLPLISQFLLNSIKKFVKYFVGPAAKQLVHLHFFEGANKIQVFYTLQVMKLMFSLFIATCSFVLFSFSIFQEENVLFRGSVIVPLVISFLAIWYALRCLVVALIPRYFDIEKLINEKKEEVLKDVIAKANKSNIADR